MPATSAGLSRLLFLFLLWPLRVLIEQTRQALCAFTQSILLRCIWQNQTNVSMDLKGLFTCLISEGDFALGLCVFNTVIFPFFKKALANAKSDV